MGQCGVQADGRASEPGRSGIRKSRMNGLVVGQQEDAGDEADAGGWERDLQELIGYSSLSNSWITIQDDQSAIHLEIRRLILGFCKSEV